MMIRPALTMVITLAAMSPAAAGCIGSGGLATCYDDSGNSYSVQRLGGQTFVEGYNSSTGSHWSQNSMDLGGMTITNGTAADGGSWNQTTMDLGGGMTSYPGTDSRGDSFSGICGPYGCN